MGNKYIHARTCVYNINYHIVWCVKYRRNVLTPQICGRLYQLVNEIGEKKGFTVVECKVGEGDHIHCFISAPPKISVTQIVKYLKGISGNTLLKEFPEIRKSLWKGQLWNGSYFCETIGSTSKENILRYIERQKKLSVMNKAIKYRLYPTTEQEVMFVKTFGCCRKVYNLMLADNIACYKETKSFGKHTPAMYKTEYPFLKEVDSLALANVQLNLQRAFTNCFEKTRKKRNGFPKFKSAKHSRKSYTTNNQKGTVAIIDNKYIKLPKIGKVKAVIHRKPATDWVIKSATISQDSDGKFYVSVLFEYECETDVVPTFVTDATTIGLDYKSDGLYTDSNGNTCGMPHYYRQSAKRLAKAQHKLKHKIIGSNNYNKQQKRIAKIHRHITNQRKDFLHKQSTAITKQYNCVCVETLNMRAMSNKGFGNGKATLDNGYGMFLNMLEYKLADRGKHFVKVDKWFPSSQLCSCCGKRHPEMKDKSIRTMYCDCGLILDRDYNAAINIKNEGLRILKSA